MTRAIAQLSSSALLVLKYMPPNITPPLVLRYGATDVPIIQLSLSSPALPDSTLNDLGQNIIRPDLAVVHGAEVPYPYGGKPRVIMADLDEDALNARGLTPSDVAKALQRQNVILPSGDVKIGSKDYSLAMNNSPDVISTINRFPVKEIDGRTVFVQDVAHVHDGYQVQTNSVAVDGTPGALMSVRKTGGVSTLTVINGIRHNLSHIRRLLPKGVTIKPIFDQSVFVKAALNSVVMGGVMAAGLTALMILLFLGNWRLTLIILATIPMAIITAMLVMYLGGETLNTMTLGGFALAIGILVDNGTVVIENIERHVGLKEPLVAAIVNGAGEVSVPTVLSTLCICIVFVPIFLLQGVAKYLFSPLSLSVCVSLIASLLLSFTLVPLLFRALMRSTVEQHRGHDAVPQTSLRGRVLAPFRAIHSGFEKGFSRFREAYRNALAFSVTRSAVTAVFFGVLMVCSLALFPLLGEDFFPQVDAGQMRLHVRAPPATRIEETQRQFADVERAIRKIVGNDQIDTMLDNIGLPYSGINIALSDSATVGPMDGEILVSLKKNHTPTAADVAELRRELPRQFPEMQFFFQAADIVDQVLNFGQPAPIDVRVSGPNGDYSFALASKIAADLKHVPGIVDSHVFQVPDAPALTVSVDRAIAQQFGLDQGDIASNVLVTTNSSAQTAPELLGQPQEFGQLSAGHSGADLPPQFYRGHQYFAGAGEEQQRARPDPDECCEARAREGSFGGISAQHPPGIRRQCRCPGNRSRDRRGRHQQSPGGGCTASGEGDPGDAFGPGGNHARKFQRAVLRHGGGCRSGLPHPRHQFPELDRSADRAVRGALCPRRGDVDAVLDRHSHQRPRFDGQPDVHRPHDGQQHPRCHLRQSAGDCWRHPVRCRGCGGLYAIAAGPDDGGRHDPGHDPDGPRHR